MNHHDYDPREGADRDPFYRADEAFIPPPSPSRGHRVAAALGKGVLAVALAVLIAAGSITGYLWATGSDLPALTAGSQEALSGQSAATEPTRTNYTLAAAQEALSTPEIFVKASPWVVSIASEVAVQNPYGGFFGQSGPYGQGGTAVSTGTGVIMRADGYILTNHHVVEGAVALTVTTSGGNEYKAALVGSDERSDIALLKIEATGLPAAEFGDSGELVVGEPAIVIGNPLGTDLADTLTQGVISSTERQVPFTSSTDGSTYYMTLVQTDAAVSPGNSGGPLINSRGQVVGLINSKIAREDVEGIGFAIPANMVLSIADDLLQNGQVTIRPTLGITVYSYTEASAQRHNETYQEEIALGTRKAVSAGIFVDSVTPGSAAALGTHGGLQPGDKITAFNGVKVLDAAELNYQKEKCFVGDTASITIERDGQTLEIEVTFTAGVPA